MNILRYILTAVLGTLSIWTICLNWKCFWFTYIKKEKAGSWIPVVPGALLMVAFILYPNAAVNRLAWIGLFIDWGCIPGFAFALLWRFVTFIKNKINQ